MNLTSSALKTRFRYKLEGFDTDWIEATRGVRRSTRTCRRASRLPGCGQRRCRRLVGAGSGLAFSIAPMFYQTGWFYGLGALLLVGLIAGAWQMRLHQVRKQFSLLLGERARLSREIHDTLLQSLVGVALQCDAMAGDLDESAAIKKQQFVRMRKQVEEYIREARQAIWDLRSPKLEHRNLAAALRDATEHAINGHDIRVEFAMTESASRAMPKVEEQVLKIGQEAVLNAVHHAHASQIKVELSYDERAMTLRVSDNGCGFDPAHVSDDHHYGLASMKERGAVVGGRLIVATGAEHGTAVTAVVPLARTA